MAGIVVPRAGAARVMASVLALALLSGCSSESEFGSRAFAVQRKHDWRKCEEIVALHASYGKQIEERKATMDKAERDAGGGFVSAVAHGPTLVSLQAERQLLHETIIEKNCTLPKPPRR